MTVPVNKSAVWLKHFLDNSNKSTFLHRTNSALLAGYGKGSSAQTMGERNYKKYAKEIGEWIDANGLSENALKQKMLSLMEATETKFFAERGLVTDQRDVPALETQRKTLDMAIRVKGMYAPERKEHSGPDGGPIQTTNFPPDTDTIDSWLKAKAQIDAEYAARLIKD